MKVKWFKRAIKALRLAKKKKLYAVEIINYSYFGKYNQNNYFEVLYAALKKEDAKTLISRSFVDDLFINNELGQTACIAQIVWAPEEVKIKHKIHDDRVFPEFSGKIILKEGSL